MANISNKLSLEFVSQSNGVISVPGFCSEFAAKEFEEMESRFYGPEATETEKKLRTKQDLFFEKESGAVILRPNLVPVSMDGQDVIHPFTGALTGHKGGWYDCYGGKWELRNIKGNPQVSVQYQNVAEEDGAATRWIIEAGQDKGLYGQGTAFAENQGVVVWTSFNLPVKNEANLFRIHLFNRDENGAVENGLFVEISSGKESRLCHYIDISTKSTYPRKKEIISQWERFSMPSSKPLYDWTAKETVFALFTVQDSIVLSINGLDSLIVFKAKQYDIGSDLNQADYPVLLRAGAELQVSGTGSGIIGFKKMVYDAEGTLETPLLFPGYALADPVGYYRAVVPAGTLVEAGGWHGGSLKMGGTVQTGPLSAAAESKGGYGVCRLAGTPVDATGGDDYYSRVTEKTPALLRFRMLDERVRETAAAETPADIEPGDIKDYTENYNVSGEMDYEGGRLTVDFAVTDDDYSAMLDVKIAAAKTYVTPIGASAATYRNVFFATAPEFSSDFGETNIRLDGKDIVEVLKNQELGMAISFDDYGYTDVQLLTRLCSMAGVTLSATGTPVLLPRSTDAKNPILYYQPKEKVWAIMQKIRRMTGKLLYPYDMTLIYKPMPTSAATADFTIGRQGYPVDEISYGRQANWRTRIYVSGQARQNTDSYRAGDKLTGAILHKTMESELGMTLTEDIFDTELADWDAVGDKLTELDKQFNELDQTVSFKITDARGYLGLRPFMVFSWSDPRYPATDGKYIMKSFSFDGDAFELSATVEGKKL